jgi:hypothetical protein
MNKFPVNPRLPNSDKISELKTRLYELFRVISNAHNDSYYWETSGTAAPTTGTWSIGDKCKNTNPSEAGSAGSKYIVTGWIYTATGWLQLRTLTGN